MYKVEIRPYLAVVGCYSWLWTLGHSWWCTGDHVLLRLQPCPSYRVCTQPPVPALRPSNICQTIHQLMLRKISVANTVFLCLAVTTWEELSVTVTEPIVPCIWQKSKILPFGRCRDALQTVLRGPAPLLVLLGLAEQNRWSHAQTPQCQWLLLAQFRD